MKFRILKKEKECNTDNNDFNNINIESGQKVLLENKKDKPNNSHFYSSTSNNNTNNMMTQKMKRKAKLKLKLSSAMNSNSKNGKFNDIDNNNFFSLAENDEGLKIIVTNQMYSEALILNNFIKKDNKNDNIIEKIKKDNNKQCSCGNVRYRSALCEYTNMSPFKRNMRAIRLGFY